MPLLINSKTYNVFKKLLSVIFSHISCGSLSFLSKLWFTPPPGFLTILFSLVLPHPCYSFHSSLTSIFSSVRFCFRPLPAPFALQTFHTPSLGDEEFEIPPISLDPDSALTVSDVVSHFSELSDTGPSDSVVVPGNSVVEGDDPSFASTFVNAPSQGLEHLSLGVINQSGGSALLGSSLGMVRSPEPFCLKLSPCQTGFIHSIIPLVFFPFSGSRSSTQLSVQQLVPGDHWRPVGRHEPGLARLQPANHYRPFGVERSAGARLGWWEHIATPPVAWKPSVGHGVAHQLTPGWRHGRL